MRLAKKFTDLSPRPAGRSVINTRGEMKSHSCICILIPALFDLLLLLFLPIFFDDGWQPTRWSRFPVRQSVKYHPDGAFGCGWTNVCHGMLSRSPRGPLIGPRWTSPRSDDSWLAGWFPNGGGNDPCPKCKSTANPPGCFISPPSTVA